MRSSLVALIGTLLIAGCSGSGSGTATARAVTSDLSAPKVSGPIEGGVRMRPWGGALPSQAPLDPYDYVEEEYFYSGVAQGLDLQGQTTGAEAPYTTRLIVVRPHKAEPFNGTVIVEWFNVTASMDLPVIFTLTHEELLRGGYAYVGVSAQTAGVQASPFALKLWDPVRYLALNHPGDAYMHDIFAQSARALVAPGGPRPLGELQPRKIIAAGESQSCILLAQYVNVVDPEHRVFDGYFLHSCATAISSRIDVPVLLFNNESELDGFTAPSDATPLPPIVADIPGLGLLRVQMLDNGVQPDVDGLWYRIWEIAGGSHFDKQALSYLVPLLAYNFAAPLPELPTPPQLPLGCGKLPNRVAMERPTRAALRQLRDWVVDGVAPPQYPRVLRNADRSIARDADGLAEGGIRMPPMVAPDGVNLGDDCPFIGSYTPFEQSQMQQRYGDEASFLAAVEQAAGDAVASGALLSVDVSEYVDEAAAAWAK